MIDFFMSHSWYDQAQEKWDALEKYAQRFTEKIGREPTFWLDKVGFQRRAGGW